MKASELLHEADFDAWLSRLVDLRVEYVVTLSPPPAMESGWILKRSDLFVPVGPTDTGDSHLYALRPSSLSDSP